MMKISENEDRPNTRSNVNGEVIEHGKSRLTRDSCFTDACKAWNLAPLSIRNAKTIYQAKHEIKKFARTLPV